VSTKFITVRLLRIRSPNFYHTLPTYRAKIMQILDPNGHGIVRSK